MHFLQVRKFSKILNFTKFNQIKNIHPQDQKKRHMWLALVNAVSSTILSYNTWVSFSFYSLSFFLSPGYQFWIKSHSWVHKSFQNVSNNAWKKKEEKWEKDFSCMYICSSYWVNLMAPRNVQSFPMNIFRVRISNVKVFFFFIFLFLDDDSCWCWIWTLLTSVMTYENGNCFWKFL